MGRGCSPGKPGKLWGVWRWGAVGEAVPGGAAGHTGSSCPLLPGLYLIACSSPATLSLLTPLYMQLYHGDGMLCSLSRRPKEKPGRELPADIHHCARTSMPSPLAGCGGAWGGGWPLSAGRALPQPAPFPSPEPEAAVALGAGRKLRVTVTHCGARLIARRCRRFITATLGSLDRTSHCGSVCPGSSGGGGQGALSPLVTLGPGHRRSPRSRHPSEWGRVGPCSFPKLCCSPSQQGPVWEALPRACPCVYGDSASPHPELQGPSAAPSSAAVMNRIFCIINN